MQQTYPIIVELLNLAEGKLSLCGGAVLDIITDCRPRDFDLFFHCASIEEADNILMKCLLHLEDKYKQTGSVFGLNMMDHIFYERSIGVLNVNVVM